MISLILLIILAFLNVLSGWWILLPILFIKLSVIKGSADIQSNFFINVLCSSKTNNKEIAITFDDGPNAIFTSEILSTLEVYKAKATFFVIGKNIAGNEDLIKKIDSQGHLIGNHTFSHSFFIDFKSKKSFLKEIGETTAIITAITGKKMQLFRPPYGVTTPAIAAAVKTLQYHIIGWNVRSLDTTADNQETITKRVIQQIKPGAVILFHDTSFKTNIVLKNILEYIRLNGFQIRPLNELLQIKAYH